MKEPAIATEWAVEYKRKEEERKREGRRRRGRRLWRIVGVVIALRGQLLELLLGELCWLRGLRWLRLRALRILRQVRLHVRHVLGPVLGVLL